MSKRVDKMPNRVDKVFPFVVKVYNKVDIVFPIVGKVCNRVDKLFNGLNAVFKLTKCSIELTKSLIEVDKV